MSLETFERLPAEKRERILSTGISAFSRSAYGDVGTDGITKACGISKGLLFHYFGSKKNFYLRCLRESMDRLTENAGGVGGTDFHEILFAEMSRKLALCLRCRDEMHMVNMASRDASGEIAGPKAELLQQYAARIRAESAQTVERAMAALTLKDEDKRQTAAEGLTLYIRAVLNRYLLEYQQTPDRFFENSEAIRREVKEYIDLMLYGICK